MVQGSLVFTNLLLVGAIIAYFYLKENKKEDQSFAQFQKIADFMVNALNTNKANAEIALLTLQEISKSKDDLTQKTLLEYLKHNERLEKLILPKPVTAKAVQEVLDHMPESVPNDIDKTDKELADEQLNDIMATIPITHDTKVAWEQGDGVISGGGSFDLEETVLSNDI